MALVYILFSKQIDRYYIGITSDSVEERIAKHNCSKYGNHRFTATSQDWILFFKIECRDISQALKIEKHIKRMKSRIYLQNLTLYPEISEKLLLKYSS